MISNNIYLSASKLHPSSKLQILQSKYRKSCSFLFVIDTSKAANKVSMDVYDLFASQVFFYQSFMFAL